MKAYNALGWIRLGFSPTIGIERGFAPVRHKKIPNCLRNLFEAPEPLLRQLAKDIALCRAFYYFKDSEPKPLDKIHEVMRAAISEVSNTLLYIDFDQKDAPTKTEREHMNRTIAQQIAVIVLLYMASTLKFSYSKNIDLRELMRQLDFTPLREAGCFDLIEPQETS